MKEGNLIRNYKFNSLYSVDFALMNLIHQGFIFKNIIKLKYKRYYKNPNISYTPKIILGGKIMEKTSKLIKISLLSAIALVLMYMDFPIIPMFPWLKMDFSDVPALMGTFAFGPVVGIIIELIKNVLYILVKGSGTGIVGETANFIMGSALIVPAGILYHMKKSKKTAVIGMIFGAVSIQIVAVITNIYFLLPAYGMAMERADAVKYILYGLIPVNGLKALCVSVITYFLYKRVSVSIFKAEPNFGSPERKSYN